MIKPDQVILYFGTTPEGSQATKRRIQEKACTLHEVPSHSVQPKPQTCTVSSPNTLNLGWTVGQKLFTCSQP